MSDQVAAALDELVPSFADEQPDWADVVGRAGRQRTRSVPSWRRRPRLTVTATALLLLLVALLATPAFGVQGFVLNLLGRKNVSFANSPSAPNEIKKQFLDLAIGAPGFWTPEVIAAHARVVATFSVAGHPRKLWVAPTRRGGYCFTFERSFGGCRQTTALRNVGKRGQLGVTWQGSPGNGLAAQLVSRVGGDITAPAATKLTARYADGTAHDVPFIWVSKPIAAGFFSYDIPVTHRSKQHRLVSLALYGNGGRLIARQVFAYQPRPAVGFPSPPTHITGPKQRHLPASPPVPPSQPQQRGSADGYSVVAGHNGSVQFTQTGTTPILKQLVGQSAGFGCFRLTKEFGIFTVRSLGQEGRFASRVAFQLNGVGTPLDGCEVQASIGHRWPDVLANHAAVEIPLTPAGRRFFANRAAARDLALFVRSRRMQQLRKEPAAQAKRDIEATYSRNLAHSPIRITVIDATSLRFSETSPTGRHFHVTVRHGRISNQSVKPYAFVF
jgi:hypothetical protein